MEHFRLTNIENEPVQLSKIVDSNKLSLFLVYHQFCLGCTGRAIPMAWEIAQKHQWMNVNLIHSNLGGQKFTKQELLSVFVSQKSPLPIYIDNEHLMYDFYEAEGTPTWLFFDQQGKLIKHIFGSQHNAKNRILYFLDEFKNS